jgi:hypothetical protein
MSANLQTLINAIPTANDGDVITRQYHNSLRDALVAIASGLGVTGTTDNTRTLAPSFLAAQPQPEWALAQGFAAKAAGGTCEGWIPLALPDGARLARMTLMGGRSGAPTPPATFTFQVQLLRQPFTETTTIPLVTIPNLTTPATQTDPFEASGVFSVTGVGTPSAIAEFQTVDNRNFKYLVRARLVGATQEMDVKIYGIRVEFNLSATQSPPQISTGLHLL